MAAWRLAIELSLGDSDVEKLRLIARSRTEPASRVERARILLGYWEDSPFFAVGQALGLHHQTVQRCVERAVAEGPMAALDDRPRPGREPDDHAGSESLVDIAVVKGAGFRMNCARAPRSRARSRRRAPVPGEHENGRRASSRARLVLRRLEGRGRKSSPSSVRMSKAISWTSSSCLSECRALKSGTPSTPRMTASPSTN